MKLKYLHSVAVLSIATLLLALPVLGQVPLAQKAPQSQPQNPLAFHVPDSKFEPVEPAPWVYEGVQKVFVGGSDEKSLQYIDELSTIGVTVIHTGGPEPYFPMHRDDPKSGPSAEKRAELKRIYDRARSHGMRIVVGIWPFAPPGYAKQHPEWRVWNTPKAPPFEPGLDLTDAKNLAQRGLSLNTPYGDYLIENIAEMMAEFKFDGVSFDGNYHPIINYAPYDTQKFKKDTGLDFPPKADLADINYRVYLIWADEQLENWYRKLHQRLRQVNPQAAVYTWTTNAGRYGHFLTIPRVMSARMNMLFDSPVQEWWLDEANLGASVVPAFGAAYVRACNGGRIGASEPYIMSRGNPYSTSSFPHHELFVRCMMAMTNGSITPIAMPSAAGKEAGDQAMREIGRRKKWFVHSTQMPWAALLVSEQTREFYAYQQVMERFLSHALGVFRIAWESHFPLTLITDCDLRPERLQPYKVLILPNAAALSDEQVKIIRDYVSNGGGLVATCETSLFDELGRARANFALSDVFGVDYQGRPQAPATRAELDVNFAKVVDDKYWANRVGAAEMRWGAGDIEIPDLVNCPELEAVMNGVQASFKGPLVKMSDPRPPMKRAMIMFPEGQGAIPAVSMGEFGKGRVVYMAAGFDAANYSYCYPYQRIVMNRAIHWAARDPEPIQVTAPMCAQSTFFEQKDAGGRRIVIHLFNGINTAADHGLPEVSVPLREEILPIAGIKIRFNQPFPTRAHLEPEGIDLKLAQKDGVCEVEVPSLAVHSMVVAEIGQ